MTRPRMERRDSHRGPQRESQALGEVTTRTACFPKAFVSAHIAKKPQHQDGPFSAKVLRDDGDESFEASQDGTVNHHRPRRGSVWVRHFLRGTVLEVEPFRELEVELNGRALERSM